MDKDASVEDNHPCLVLNILRPEKFPTRYSNMKCAARTVLFRSYEDQQNNVPRQWVAFHEKFRDTWDLQQCVQELNR